MLPMSEVAITTELVTEHGLTVGLAMQWSKTVWKRCFAPAG